MNLDRKNTEIEDAAHKMWVEGTCDDEPTVGEVIDFMVELGWRITYVQVWFDGMQGFWRWSADLKEKIK